MRLVRLRIAGLVLALAGVTVSAHTPAEHAAARSPRNANYTLAATLDPATHTITGRGQIRWRNITSQPTAELQFHLYWNAWRDDHSSFIRESRLGRMSMAGRPAEDRGRIDLTALSLGGADLLGAARFIAPDDGNPDDRTVLRVPLAAPVAPGAEIAVDVAWTAQVPRTYSRTGRIGDYYFVAQWFPKLGVLEEAGWNCHQFHVNTEFFSDFGVYDVTLDVPAGWTIGATGQSTDGRRFVQGDVHDFAWTTSPDFVERVEDFNEAGLPPVRMRLLLQPEHATTTQIERHFEGTRIALRNYGRWYGPYPYGHITIVDPVAIFNGKTQGGKTGGMEYPTLFTAGTRLRAIVGGDQPTSVTIHEAGHQFWYGIVATNEFEHAWMDEGVNTFSTARAIATEFPQPFGAVERYFGDLVPWIYPDARWTREITGDRLDAYRAVASFDAQSTPSWRAWPGASSAITYNKTALWLNTLERLLGWETTRKILATHFARGAFRHPTPAEFFAIANEVSGRDLGWFFEAVHRSNAVFDYAVQQVTPVKSGDGYDNLVAIRRVGSGVFPVDVKTTFTDGTSVVEHWDGAGTWRAFDYRRPVPVATVEVDPDRVLLLDVNRTNNSWTARPQTGLAVKRWVLRWVTWAEELLLSYAFFA